MSGELGALGQVPAWLAGAGLVPAPGTIPDPAFLRAARPDPDSFLKSARLQRLPSSSSELGSQDLSPLQETSKDPFAGACSCRQDGLTIIITACLTFAAGVTVALLMQIYFGDPQVR